VQASAISARNNHPALTRYTYSVPSSLQTLRMSLL
jgi:hypothetical protein